jgi:hypothetical protein
VAPACHEQFKLLAIYPIIQQVWNTDNLDSWASIISLDVKACGDIIFDFHQSIERSPNFNLAILTLVECGTTKEDFIWCHILGMRRGYAVAHSSSKESASH